MVDSAVVAVYGLQVHVLLFIKKLLQPVDFFRAQHKICLSPFNVFASFAPMVKLIAIDIRYGSPPQRSANGHR